jgi:hypothetical protein
MEDNRYKVGARRIAAAIATTVLVGVLVGCSSYASKPPPNFPDPNTAVGKQKIIDQYVESQKKLHGGQ